MVSVDYAAIGQRIKERRKELGLNQKELAAKVGLSEASVSKYEHGKVEDATHAMLSKFAAVLDVSVAWLLGLETRPKVESLTAEEKHLLEGFRRLNRQGKDYLLQTLDMAAATYTEDPAAVKRA